ncbi:hypothetical protein D3C74_395450 [compost metagenome]
MNDHFIRICKRIGNRKASRSRRFHGSTIRYPDLSDIHLIIVHNPLAGIKDESKRGNRPACICAQIQLLGDPAAGFTAAVRNRHFDHSIRIICQNDAHRHR